MIRPINRTLLQTQILVKKAPPFYGNLSINYFLPTTPKAEGRLVQEYGILPHSRTYYCLLFSLYHMFIVFVISY